jgi:trehalose 6-phosphate phosphatase
MLTRHPASTCLLTDFDGTLADIVDDPARARPLPGAEAILRRLAANFACVAVVSGRPAEFLAAHLQQGVAAGLRLIGLYGLESVSSDGRVVIADGAEEWRAVIERAAGEAEADAPSGSIVERKGLAVTLHWRTTAHNEQAVTSLADRLALEHGLVVHPARMSVELRPPVSRDKGSAVRELTSGYDAACFLGDDLGDLPAYDALDELAAAGATTLKVVASGSEVPPELLRRADLRVDGPHGALALLSAVADAADAAD